MGKVIKHKGHEIEVTENMPEGYVDDSELWENGTLGRSAEHAKPAPKEVEEAIDNALNLAPITIRLQKELVADLKKIAAKEGLGYQAYVRQILTKHVAATK